MTSGITRPVKQTGLGYFVTGTDTGVGKTAISAALAQAIQERGMTTGVMKPIETGVHESRFELSDAFRLCNAVTPRQSLESVTQYQFPDPLAPLTAARRGDTSIDLTVIQAAYAKLAQDCQCILVEGIGGVMVPLTKTLYVRDLIKTLGLPCIVVGSTALGGINHIQLTLEALRICQIQIVAIALNHGLPSKESEDELQQRNSTVDLIQELSGVPVYGPIKYEAELSGEWSAGVSKLKQQGSIQKLADSLLSQKPR